MSKLCSAPTDVHWNICRETSACMGRVIANVLMNVHSLMWSFSLQCCNAVIWNKWGMFGRVSMQFTVGLCACIE